MYSNSGATANLQGSEDEIVIVAEGKEGTLISALQDDQDKDDGQEDAEDNENDE